MPTYHSLGIPNRAAQSFLSALNDVGWSHQDLQQLCKFFASPAQHRSPHWIWGVRRAACSRRLLQSQIDPPNSQCWGELWGGGGKEPHREAGRPGAHLQLPSPNPRRPGQERRVRRSSIDNPPGSSKTFWRPLIWQAGRPGSPSTGPPAPDSAALSVGLGWEVEAGAGLAWQEEPPWAGAAPGPRAHWQGAILQN